MGPHFPPVYSASLMHERQCNSIGTTALHTADVRCYVISMGTDALGPLSSDNAIPRVGKFCTDRKVSGVAAFYAALLLLWSKDAIS